MLSNSVDQPGGFGASAGLGISAGLVGAGGGDCFFSQPGKAAMPTAKTMAAASAVRMPIAWFFILCSLLLPLGSTHKAGPAAPWFLRPRPGSFQAPA